ncbi:SPW repeat domain-containing protein [Gemmata sp.]|uniref:SPW repeat domain-containing protein n=1 Tax=Gemmata sp. TaxID=1914242 RepID=UPI003F72A514
MYPQLAAFAVGVWLTAAPETLGYGYPARGSDHIVGPLAATVGLAAAFAATRPLRWLNLPFGAWLLLAPWVLGYGRTELVNGTICGLLLASLSFASEKAAGLGGGWRMLWDPAADPARAGGAP